MTTMQGLRDPYRFTDNDAGLLSGFLPLATECFIYQPKL